jgi:SM-20-related protein
VTGPALAIDQRVVDAMAEDLGRNGYAVALRALSPSLTSALKSEAGLLAVDAGARDGGTGRGAATDRTSGVRRSRIKWIDGETDGQRMFLAAAEQTRAAINQTAFLGLFEFECQFTLYPCGGFYGRHLDSFAGARNRIVSIVVYLNEGWATADGGQLDIWRDRQDAAPLVATVQPEAGTIVLMMSEDIPHEVRVAHRDRASIAGWWRTRPVN